MIIAFKDQGYCAALNMPTNEFLPSQVLLNPVMNEQILSLKTFSLAGDQQVIVSGFNFLNQMSAKRM